MYVYTVHNLPSNEPYFSVILKAYLLFNLLIYTHWHEIVFKGQWFLLSLLFIGTLCISISKSIQSSSICHCFKCQFLGLNTDVFMFSIHTSFPIFLQYLSLKRVQYVQYFLIKWKWIFSFSSFGKESSIIGLYLCFRVYYGAAFFIKKKLFIFKECFSL